MSMYRLYIKQAMSELNIRDKRTFKRWCNNHGVGILSDNGSKKKYVIKEEFEIAKSRLAIKYLSEKYGKDNFPSAFQSFLNIQSEINSVRYEKTKKLSCSSYKPSGKHEVTFMNRLQKIINKV